MKKYTTILVMALLMVQLLCCPLAMAETTDTTIDTTTDTVGETTTTTGEITDQTTTTQDLITDTTTTTTDTTDESAGDTVTTTTTVEFGTVVSTSLVILNEDGKIAARLTDAAGAPIGGVYVGLQLGSTKLPGAWTDENGYADFNYNFPGNNTYVYCYTERTAASSGIVYEAAAASVGTSPSTTTAATDDEQPVYTGTRGSTTYRSYYMPTAGSTKSTEELTRYTAAGTTGMKESYITLDFAFDSGILDSFKTDQNTFASTAKLMLTPESYAQMLGGANGVLMMSVVTSASTVSDEQITASVKDDAVLSHVDVSGVDRIVLDMSVQFKDAATGQISDIWDIPGDTYAVQMPVPDSMRSAQYITVAAVTAEGVSEPVYATVSEDGVMLFESTSPAGTIVILGFDGSMLGTFREYSVRIALIFLIIGLLCIGVAIFLYFRFVRRPKKSKKKAGGIEMTEQDAQDNEMAMPLLSEEFVMMDHGGELDIFDDEDPAPLHQKDDTDIDIPL